MKLPFILASTIALLLPFSCAHALEDVPFVTTPDSVTLAMLQLAKVAPADYVIDLGSGDGRIVIIAAKHFGARGLGVEIVDHLVRTSRENAKQAGVGDRAEFREQDLFATDLSPASVITLYLLPDVNLQLRPRILALKPGTRVVSHDWDMADWKPDKSITVAAPDKKIGLEKSSKVHLWIVPARVEGVWCGTGTAAGSRLELAQTFQEIVGTLRTGDAAQSFDASIEGALIRSPENAAHRLAMKIDGPLLRVTSAGGTLQSMRGASFERAPGRTACTTAL
jgi:hypothetical protein